MCIDTIGIDYDLILVPILKMSPMIVKTQILKLGIDSHLTVLEVYVDSLDLLRSG